MNPEIYADETIEDLQYKGLKLIQKKEGFRFGVDSVLLSNFVQIEKKQARVMDLGTGTGIIPILLAAKTLAAEIIGLEIQESIAEMASRSVSINGLDDKIKIITGDLKNAVNNFGAAAFDVITTNPPYTKWGGGLINPQDMKAISRHEIYCRLEDVVSVSSKLLKQYGTFYMVHRPDRLVDIICLMRSYKLEPKLIRFIHPSYGRAPNLLLVKGLKCGNAQLTIMDPLYIYNENKEYTDEILKIYGK